MISRISVSQFQKKIYAHYLKEKRSLPWRRTRNPYHILVSELMLQQTQVLRVIPKYRAFLKQFPNLKTLALLPTKEVLSAWSGLGYNRRALYLKRAAEAIVTLYKGQFPKAYEELIALPGIGPYTASAIMVFAYNEPLVVIETNIRAVFIHFFFPLSKKVPDSTLVPLIEKYMDRENPREWYNALMDYGAMLKRTLPNPARRSVHHVKQSAFSGSDRQVRGAIVKAYTRHPRFSKARLLHLVPYEKIRVENQYKKLVKEGFFKD